MLQQFLTIMKASEVGGLSFGPASAPRHQATLPHSLLQPVLTEENSLEKLENGQRKEEVEIVTTEKEPPPSPYAPPPLLPSHENSKMTSPLAQ